MQADDLDVRARLRQAMRCRIDDLRLLGVDEAAIQRCRTLPELDDLKSRVLAELQRAPRRQ